MFIEVLIGFACISVTMACGFYLGTVVKGKAIQPIYNLPEVKVQVEYPVKEIPVYQPADYAAQKVALEATEQPDLAGVYRDVMDEFLEFGDFRPDRKKSGDR